MAAEAWPDVAGMEFLERGQEAVGEAVSVETPARPVGRPLRTVAGVEPG